MSTIPGSIDEVTAAWLTDVLGLPVTRAEADQIGVGVGVSSALYRVRLEGDGCPASVVVKLPALDEAAVFTSTMLRMYIREVRFFQELAASSPIRVPACHHAAVDEETSRFVVVMEDMVGNRLVDQLAGMDLTDAERAVDALAQLHSQWWRKADDLATSGITVSLGDPIYPAVLPFVYGEGWDKVTAGMELSPEIADVGPHWSEMMPRLLRELSAPPTTLCHGDYRADNILFTDDGSVVLLDFQLTGTGRGAYDLAYFVTQSLDSTVASVNERALFDRWIAGLRAGGVPEADLEGQWDDYRKAAYFCLVYPIVASRGMDLTDPRQLGLLDSMNTRITRAIAELDLRALLGG